MDDTFEFDVKKQRFFIAVSALGTHTFLMLGAYSDFQVDRLLCRVGKAFQSRGASFWEELWSLFQAMFSSAPAYLYDEGTSRQLEGNHPIDYIAFDISYQQYLEFVALLESLETERDIYYCYKPRDKDASQGVLQLTSNKLYRDRASSESVRQFVGELNLFNTCRHSAIHLAERVMHRPLDIPVSTCFMTRLPYHTRLQFGAPSKAQPFYVMPLPPTAFAGKPALAQGILNRLYHRMEELVYLNPMIEGTQTKFRLLKDYYERLAGDSSAPSAADLLSSIKLWRLDHNQNLSELRQRYLWDFFVTRTSKTNKMLDEIEQELSAQLA